MSVVFFIRRDLSGVGLPPEMIAPSSIAGPRVDFVPADTKQRIHKKLCKFTGQIHAKVMSFCVKKGSIQWA